MKITSILCCFAVILMCAALPVLAQDPVKAAPQSFKERLNNDHVRVLEFTSKPGQKDPMHSHPDMVLYVIKGGTLRSTGPDGTSKDIVYKTGDVMWRDAITHSGENIGKTEMKALLIETKSMSKK
jgi:quercetin dioxygenase-like cupin family protein